MPGFYDDNEDWHDEYEEPVGRKYDAGKLRTNLWPWSSFRECCLVLGHGATKYGEDNWKDVANARSRYLDAAGRHVLEYQEGSKYDADSGFHHLAHAAVSLMFVAWFDLTGKK